MPSSAHCYYHAPELARERAANNRKGGKRGGRGRPFEKATRIQARLEELAENVLEGSVETSKASVAGQLYHGALRALSVSLKAKEVEELEARLEEVEARLEQQGQRGRRWG